MVCYLAVKENSDWEGTFTQPLKVFLSKDSADLFVMELNEKNENNVKLLNKIENKLSKISCDPKKKNLVDAYRYEIAELYKLDFSENYFYCVKELELVET
jgi:hypothetical protein